MGRLTQYFKQQRGDTIVEVLISITVVSLILGSAYVTTNKSLQSTRSAQERSNALKLAESQVEQLKGAVANSATAATIYSTFTPFCIYTNPATGVINVVPTSNANCTVNTGGTPTTTEPKFNMSVTHNSASPNDFVIKNTWYNINGKSTDQVTIRYRVYQ